MRSDLELKYMQGVALQKTVRKAFLKRGFKDSFTEEEMIKIMEIDTFLRAVSLHKDNPMFEDKQIKYICLSLCSSYKRKNGATVSVFYNKFVNQEDFEYQKIPYYIAKCIYKLIRNRHIEVFFAVNSFKASCIKEKVYIPERKGENVVSSCALYTDIDLPSELVNLSNEEILSLLRADYQELFANLEPSYIVRSGGGVHLYYQLNESYYIKTQEQRTFYMDALRSLQRLFEDYGADCRCVDITRILRVPYSRNRKPKYGANGKEVSIIYKTDNIYDVFELSDKLRFLLSGGMNGACQSVLDDIFYDYGETEQAVIDRTEETDELEVLEVPVDTLEEIPKERKTTATVKRLIDYGYKGIQPYYNYNGETYFQNRDMMCFIQNRENHEGLRNTLLWFFSYNWYVYNGVRDYDSMLQRSEKLNEFFHPSLDRAELVTAVKYNLRDLDKREHFNKAIRNTTIQSYLHFTEEEKRCCLRGLYYDTYEEYLNAVRLKKIRESSDRYTKQLEQNGALRRTEQKALNMRILEENPLMSYREFYQLTGLSRPTYDIYKRELGNSREKHFSLHKEYYLQPFIDNPDISSNEYMELLNCSYKTFIKYRKIYRDSNI